MEGTKDMCLHIVSTWCMPMAHFHDSYVTNVNSHHNPNEDVPIVVKQY